MGAGLLAKAVVQSISLLDLPDSSRASPVPQGLWPAVGLAFTEDQNCGSGLAKAWFSQYLYWICRTLRGQARSHRDCGQPWDWRSLKIKTVGAGLRRRGSANISIGFAGLFAGKPAPQGFWPAVDWRSLKIKTVGRGLPRRR
ncbi:hypothetical protein PputUW4_03043 [Pseudomonas sp. UW4]|nr:hypothetical protein PputUW4_03043 [Pseudomonas sp. UW4]